MEQSAQAAEMVTRVVLLGSTFFLRLGGKGMLTMASFLAAATSENAKQSGKVRLKRLLQSGSELKVFTLQGEDNFSKFAMEAKDYGILYSVVRRTDTDVENEVFDIMVRAEDASKINRVIEKFYLIDVEGTVVETTPEEVRESEVIDARTLLSRMLERQGNTVNPQEASEGPYLSDASLRIPNQTDRPSVVEELNQYIEEATNKQEMDGIMPNLMSEDIREEEKKLRGAASELLGNMLSSDKEPVLG